MLSNWVVSVASSTGVVQVLVLVVGGVKGTDCMYDCFARCALLNCCYLVPRGNSSSFVFFVFASIFGLSTLNSAIFIMPAFSSCVFVQRVTVMLVGCVLKAAASTRRGRLPGPLQAFVLAKCDVEAMAAGGRYNCIRRRYWPASSIRPSNE